MDEGKIAFMVGVELSYLPDDLQYVLLGLIEELDCTPSYSQAWQMHKDYSAGVLTEESIEERMNQPKPNQTEMFRMPAEKLKNMMPQSYTQEQREDFILKACAYYRRHLERQKAMER